jgi:glycosyltransferase involved in cell wall biosynthesis
MKKALLYFGLDLQNNHDSGIARKCLGIADAFKSRYEADVFNDSFGKVYFNDVLLKDFYKTPFSARMYNYNDMLFGQFDKLDSILTEKKYDILYFRFQYFLSIGMLSFFKKIKKYNPGAKIYLEIPTYPFKKEKGNHLFNRLRYFLNGLLIPFLKKRVDKIITFAELDTVWNVPAITISNGYYNPQLTKIINRSHQQTSLSANEFHIAMVARFAIGHAPDILVESIRAYYESYSPLQKKVFVHFIGHEYNLNLCKSLVKKYVLQDYVFFHGAQQTEKIVEILDRAHVCVGTLGFNRKDVLIDSSLKNREYAFMGMPMILRTRDLDFDPSLFFVKYFPEPESLINISEVMEFYYSMSARHPRYKEEIIDFAENNLTWKKKMQTVFRDIEDDKDGKVLMKVL